MKQLRPRGIATGIPPRAVTGQCDTGEPCHVVAKCQSEKSPGNLGSHRGLAEQACETAAPRRPTSADSDGYRPPAPTPLARKKPGPRPRPLEDRIREKTLIGRTRGDCHVWCGPTAGQGGYPVINNGRQRTMYVHRYVLERRLGRALAVGEYACHSCDTPACVNADHLWPGSARDNMRDAARKGRTTQAYSEETMRAAFTEIRDGGLVKQVARKYGIARTTLTTALAGKSWAHVLESLGMPTPYHVGHPCGMRLPGSKLSDEQVAEIRQLRASGLTQQAVADRFGVSQSHVHRVTHMKQRRIGASQ